MKTQEWKQGSHCIGQGKDGEDNSGDRTKPVDSEDVLKGETKDFAGALGDKEEATETF